MGRGPKTPEFGVKKQKEKFFSSENGQPGGDPQEKKDGCLFSFQTTLHLSVDRAHGVKKESPVVIILNYTKAEKIELFIQGRNMGEYKGPRAGDILKCIKKNYIYEGYVQSINKTLQGIKILYQLKGKKRK